MTHTEIVPGGLSAKFKFRVCQTTVEYREAYGSSPRPFNAMLLGKFTHNPDEMVLDMVSAASEEARDAYLRVGYRKIIKPWFEVDNAGRTTATYRVLAVAPNLETPLLNADGRPYMKAMRIPASLAAIFNMPEQDILGGKPTEQDTITIPTPLTDLADNERLVFPLRHGNGGAGDHRRRGTASLSTAGYGDILPASMWARMLAGLEVTIGVLYIAILVARLVSLYNVQRKGVV